MLEADKASTRELSAFLAKDTRGVRAQDEPGAPAPGARPDERGNAAPSGRPSTAPNAGPSGGNEPPTPKRDPEPKPPEPSAPAPKPEGVDDGKDAPSKLSPNPFGDGASK